MSRQDRLARAAGQVTARLGKVALRGQLGPVQETQLARLTGARR
ncbi:MAG TPA: hypothetical protein VK992_00915 [Candidatus Caenarcaniphilales bacterium]|nr:hypothetical protein [Candidatus Caenarcaniphilales bacterium]